MKTKPYKHQWEEFSHHGSDPSRALLWQMRTGKSKVIIDSACMLERCFEISGIFLVAPNDVHLNWIIQELPRHHWDDVSYSAHAWKFTNPDNAEEFERFMGLDSDLKWFAVNMEVLIRDEVKKAFRIFSRVCPRFMYVVDESHHFARPGAKRTSTARSIARKAAYRRILTGTSVENSPLQAFSQFELLEKEALGHTRFGDFKDRYAVFEEKRRGPTQRYKVVKEYVRTDELRERMSRFTSVVLREDCEDLPPVQEDKRYFQLTKEQLKLRRTFIQKDVEELEKIGFFKPVPGSARLVKLHQIEGGYLKTDEGIANITKNNPKLSVLLDEISQYDGSVIVWCQFTHEVEELTTLIRKAGFTTASFYGKTKNRMEVKKRFHAGQFKVLVGQPKAGGEGYDFSVAGKIIWYSQTPDAIVRSQATERATAVGGESVQVVSIVAENGVDEYFIELTDAKISLADDISRRGMQEILGHMQMAA